jgi:hypothetical protein
MSSSCHVIPASGDAGPKLMEDLQAGDLDSDSSVHVITEMEHDPPDAE